MSSVLRSHAPGLQSSSIAGEVKKAVAGMQPFTVRLTGHEVLKHGNATRTLCLAVEDPEPINALITALDPKPEAKRTYRQTSILDKRNYTKKEIHPHVTIARTIAVADFDRIDDPAAYDLQAEWVCDSVTILRRVAGSTGPFGPCKVVRMG